MARASATRFVLEAAALPALPGALDLARAGVETDGAAHNRRFVAAALTVGPGVAPESVALAHDPQTSGGLLAAVPEDRLAAVDRGARRGRASPGGGSGRSRRRTRPGSPSPDGAAVPLPEGRGVIRARYTRLHPSRTLGDARMPKPYVRLTHAARPGRRTLGELPSRDVGRGPRPRRRRLPGRRRSPRPADLRALQLLEGDERGELRRAEVRQGRHREQQRRQLQPHLTRSLRRRSGDSVRSRWRHQLIP